MAGYAGYSKSNNAIDAEKSGIYNATQLARKLKCSTTAIKALLKPAEWHHTSGWFNKTDYYDEPLLLSLAGQNVDPERIAEYSEEEVSFARTLLEKLRAYKVSEKKQSQEFADCSIQWLEWSGTRKYPKANKRTASGCSVVQKGSMLVISGGSLGKEIIRKKIGCNGLVIKDANGKLLFN